MRKSLKETQSNVIDENKQNGIWVVLGPYTTFVQATRHLPVVMGYTCFLRIVAFASLGADVSNIWGVIRLYNNNNKYLFDSCQNCWYLRLHEQTPVIAMTEEVEILVHII